MIEKLISGGQTGVDRVGLEVAKELGIPTGGTAPKGWLIVTPEGGVASDPSLAEFGLVEHTEPGFPPRTRQNVFDSDGTVWFGTIDSLGARLTLSTTQRSGKPTIVNPSADELRRWIRQFKIKTLNVAGNRMRITNLEPMNQAAATLFAALKPEEQRL